MMNTTRRPRGLKLAILMLSLCGFWHISQADPLPLRIVSTPNPNVFPLLLAMSNQPQLPVTLLPVGTAGEASTALINGSADGLLSMTYTAAQMVTTGKVPDLALVSVDFWNGFSVLAPQNAQITSFTDLINHGVLIAGPTSGGKGSGPDLIFQAAARRAGLDASSFALCYLPVMQAVPLLLSQAPMNSNPACNPADSSAATAISLVEPAATGLVLQSRSGDNATGLVRKVIPLQPLFSGYTAWPSDELPHGGLSIRGSVLNAADSQQTSRRVLLAYEQAAAQIMAAKPHPLQLMRIAQTISAGITAYYGQYGLSIPAPVIFAALESGDFRYRTDRPLAAIEPDLNRFLAEVVGSPIPDSFFHPLP
ncbi:hypothetical protein [Halothiobacillus sp. DCM-1]|uniref:hypothetical protein n=1 Tax=Halothiobacillus sp. DCM-1 TaxID=3112558 RepID=UPI0032442DBD